MATQLLIDGTRFAVQDPAFAPAIADAHRRHLRPCCTCQPTGVEMYVAKAGDNFVVKRMPYTASRHATHCPHARFDSSPDIRARAVQTSGEASSTHGVFEHRIELDRLLPALWERAGLTQWHPGFEGKRNWAVVRHHLLTAVSTYRFQGNPFADRLHVPEPFRVESMRDIEERRRTMWAGATASSSDPQRGLLVLGTLKRLEAQRDFSVCIIKHLPTQPLAMHARARELVNQRFRSEIAFWRASPQFHLVVLAAVTLSTTSQAMIRELTLMSVTRHWLPVTDALDAARVERMVQAKQSFLVQRRPQSPERISHVSDSSPLAHLAAPQARGESHQSPAGPRN